MQFHFQTCHGSARWYNTRAGLMDSNPEPGQKEPWEKKRAGLKMGLSDSFGSCTLCCVYGCQVCSTVCRFGCEHRKNATWITYCSDSISLSQSVLVSFWKTVLLLWTWEMYLNEAITKRPEGRVWGGHCEQDKLCIPVPAEHWELSCLHPTRQARCRGLASGEWHRGALTSRLVNDSLLPRLHALSEVGNQKEQFFKTPSYTNIL